MASLPVGRRRIILMLLLTAVLLLTLDLRGNTLLDRARSGFVWALAPFESAAQVVTRPVVDAWRGITEYDRLTEDNRRLQEQLDAQRGAEIAARNAIVENQQLRALNDLDSLANIPTVTASIIGDSPSNLDQIVEIDRGSRQGIDVGMAVVNEAGLVGKITRVFPDSSLVMLITDSRYAVEAKVLAEERPPDATEPPTTVPSGLDVEELQATTTTTTVVDPALDPEVDSDGEVDPADPDAPGADPVTGDDESADAGPAVTGTTTTTIPLVIVQRETGALLGQGAGRLPQVNFVTNTPTLGRIVPGDAVFTTGGRNSLAPPDIPIGTVANVITRPGSGGTRLEIEPSADLSRLQFVRVVLYKPPVEVGG